MAQSAAATPDEQMMLRSADLSFEPMLLIERFHRGLTGTKRRRIGSGEFGLQDLGRLLYQKR
jgi:hypothetical protein